MRVAQEPATLGRDRVGGAHDLHPQTGVAAEFPQHAAAHLKALAVVARQFDQRLRVLAQELLQFPMYLRLIDRCAVRIGETGLNEPIHFKRRELHRPSDYRGRDRRAARRRLAQRCWCSYGALSFARMGFKVNRQH